MTFDAKAGWLKIVRGDVLCLFNFSDAPQRVRMPPGRWELALGSDTTEARLAEEVPAQATLIYTAGSGTRVIRVRRDG